MQGFFSIITIIFCNEILKSFDHSSKAEWNNNKFDSVECFVGENYSTLFVLPNICPLKPDVLFSFFFPFLIQNLCAHKLTSGICDLKKQSAKMIFKPNLFSFKGSWKDIVNVQFVLIFSYKGTQAARAFSSTVLIGLIILDTYVLVSFFF